MNGWICFVRDAEDDKILFYLLIFSNKDKQDIMDEYKDYLNPTESASNLHWYVVSEMDYKLVSVNGNVDIISRDH